MKVVLVGPSYPYRGGISLFTQRLFRELGTEEEVLLVNFRSLYPTFLFPGKSQEVPPEAIPGPSGLRLLHSYHPWVWRSSFRPIIEFQPEVVIFQWWHPFFAPLYLSLARSLKKVVKIAVCHNVLPHEGGGFLKGWVKLGLCRMDGLIVHAQSELERARSLFPDKPCYRAFHPIYDHFPSSQISQERARQTLGIPSEKRVLLFFGLVRRYKGVDILVQAMTKIPEPEKYYLLIVGEVYGKVEELIPDLVRLPKQLYHIEDRFIPEGEAELWFKAADVVVLPYRSATQSGVIPLAYHYLKPVIATQVGGLSEVVEDGVSGLLVPPEDSNSLAEAIMRFFQDSHCWGEGVEKWRRELSWSRYCSILKELISEVKSHRG